jgi:integrase
MTTRARRRHAGEGCISEYSTKSGPRFLIKYAYPRDDGTQGTVLKRGFATRKAAAEELRKRLNSIDEQRHVAPHRMTVGAFMSLWLDGLNKQPSTVASYRKNVRLHVTPHIGALRLDQLTGSRLTKLYRDLEKSGRHDGQGGLSARTVRYIHTIVHSALSAAVRDGLLAGNPATAATPPSAKAATSPEMAAWTAAQLRVFLEQRAAASDELRPAWVLLASTGMRRGEALALRWGDVDLEAGRISIRRSATVVPVEGDGRQVLVGPPKSGKPRTVDVDPDTIAVLRGHRSSQGSVSLALARDDAYVLADVNGKIRHPERFSRRWETAVRQARAAVGEDALPVIRLHDLRHTHATVLLGAGIPVKVVSERLGHANATITLGVYTHVMPGMQAEAAARFAALLSGSSG